VKRPPLAEQGLLATALLVQRGLVPVLLEEVLLRAALGLAEPLLERPAGAAKLLVHPPEALALASQRALHLPGRDERLLDR
jgi:hypothetical protein